MFAVSSLLFGTFGPSAPFGMIYSTDPLLIIFIVPIVGLITQHVDSYTIVLAVAAISEVSPFWMSLGVSQRFIILSMVIQSLLSAGGFACDLFSIILSPVPHP